MRGAGTVPGVLIIDTDIGSDPDDAVALIVAATCTAPGVARRDDQRAGGGETLALVITNDEIGGERARLARHLLDLVGRPDVPVVAGAEAPDAPAMVMSAPPTVVPQPTGVLEAVRQTVEARPGEPVRWLGIGAMTNLAALVGALGGGWSALPERLRIVQMGGALNYRHPDRAEHNVRRDPSAVSAVLRSAAELRFAHRPSFVLSEHTFRPEIAIDPRSPLYRYWSRPDAAAWERFLVAHHDGFFARYYPQSLEHDPLTLSAALDHPWVTFIDAALVLDDSGRMTLNPRGFPVRLSQSVDYAGFLAWLDRWVGPPRQWVAAVG